MTPKLYNTPNVLHNPATKFVDQAPVPPPNSLAAASSAQKQMRASGIQTTKTAYVWGVEEACVHLGLTKSAGRLNPLRSWFQRILEGPYGEYAVRTPVQATMGAMAGAASGQLYSGHPGQGAILGGLSGGLGGLAVAGAPHLRQKLLTALARKG